MVGAPRRLRLVQVATAALLGFACSSSASKVTDNDGSDGTGGTTGGTSNTGGNSGSGSGGTNSSGGTGGSSGATGGTSSTGGSTGAGGGGSPNDQCPEGMAYIPAGSLTIENDPNPVDLDPFCIDIDTVTSGEYAACASCSPTDTDDLCNAPHAFRDGDPANCLDAAQAEFYCQTLGKSLPSEYAWEWAARGGVAANAYPWGDEAPSGSDSPHRLCWLPARTDVPWPDRPSGTCPVGFYDQAADHPFGLEDMSGNVWQWTTSQGTTMSNRVVRGGGYDNNDPVRVSTSYRNPTIAAGTRHNALGFRCVADVLE